MGIQKPEELLAKSIEWHRNYVRKLSEKTVVQTYRPSYLMSATETQTNRSQVFCASTSTESERLVNSVMDTDFLVAQLDDSCYMD